MVPWQFRTIVPEAFGIEGHYRMPWFFHIRNKLLAKGLFGGWQPQ